METSVGRSATLLTNVRILPILTRDEANAQLQGDRSPDVTSHETSSPSAETLPLTCLLIIEGRIAAIGEDSVATALSAQVIGEDDAKRAPASCHCDVSTPSTPATYTTVDAKGAYLIPGLADAHAHLDLEAARTGRIDTLATRSPEDAIALVTEFLTQYRSTHDGENPPSIQGFGHRLGNWDREPTIRELDEVTGDIPTILVSGDAHSGWLNSAALHILGLPGATEDNPGEALREDPWFAQINRMDLIPGNKEMRDRGYRMVVEKAVAAGVTSIVDMSWEGDPQATAERFAAMAEEGLVLPRLSLAVYREHLAGRIEAGLTTGEALAGSPLAGDGQPLLTQGPLKVIADGSMGTASAHMCLPYPPEIAGEHTHGIANISREELTELLRYATDAGFECAIHAIGDAAVTDVAEAFVASGARGRLEHAQLLPDECGCPEAATEDRQHGGSFNGSGALAALVACKIGLSVQPAHLIDDWEMVEKVWPGKAGRTYAFADMMAAGAHLYLGSDAPVAPLDPWRAMASAVGRATPDGDVWSPEQRLTVEQALACSVAGEGSLRVGDSADFVLLSEDLRGLDAQALSQVTPLATAVGGVLCWHSVEN